MEPLTVEAFVNGLELGCMTALHIAWKHTKPLAPDGN
jgi:hypothetical protein